MVRIGGLFMRRGNRRKTPVGWIIVTVGIIVLLSQILPAGFWWFLLGACLIGVGICINRNCCWGGSYMKVIYIRLPGFLYRMLLKL